MLQTLAVCHYPHPRNTTLQRILSRPEVNALLSAALSFGTFCRLRDTDGSVVLSATIIFPQRNVQ
jgi:hypothetical protein